MKRVSGLRVYAAWGGGTVSCLSAGFLATADFSMRRAASQTDFTGALSKSRLSMIGSRRFRTAIALVVALAIAGVAAFRVPLLKVSIYLRSDARALLRSSAEIRTALVPDTCSVDCDPSFLAAASSC